MPDGSDWLIDGQIELSRTCEKCMWHLGTVEGCLVAEGLSLQDARAFAAFSFAEASASGEPPRSFLSDEQWGRISEAEPDSCARPLQLWLWRDELPAGGWQMLLALRTFGEMPPSEDAKAIGEPAPRELALGMARAARDQLSMSLGVPVVLEESL